ncbi:Exocyst complex component S5, partial [Dipsacomyces acuminosporus]
MAIDDAEILARYGLDTFESPTFGNSDEVVIDAGSRKHAEQQNELGIEDLHDGSITQHSRLNRQGMNAGSEENGNEGGEDYDEDEDEDDEDDEYENERFKDPLSSNGVATHNVAFSDRDPLHVLPSVTAVLERKSDPRLLGDLTYRAKFSISHKSFSPTAFMQVVHSDTSYADLVQGTRLLRESVYQGSEALKILVHNNFDRFVDARSKIDLFYEEMKSRALNESAEY